MTILTSAFEIVELSNQSVIHSQMIKQITIRTHTYYEQVKDLAQSGWI